MASPSSDRDADKPRADERRTDAASGPVSRDREIELQEVIVGLVRGRRPPHVADAERALRDAITARGLPSMSRPWVRAVAEGIMRGEAYVVSPRTAKACRIPDPPHHAESYGID